MGHPLVVNRMRFHAPNAGGPSLILVRKLDPSRMLQLRSLCVTMKIMLISTKTQCSQNKQINKNKCHFSSTQCKIFLLWSCLKPSVSHLSKAQKINFAFMYFQENYYTLKPGLSGQQSKSAHTWMGK